MCAIKIQNIEEKGSKVLRAYRIRCQVIRKSLQYNPNYIQGNYLSVFYYFQLLLRYQITSINVKLSH